jgi:hypothetical protein
MSSDVVVAMTEEETAGVSNNDGDNDEDGHADTDDEADYATVAAEGEDGEHCRHQSI